MSEHEPAPVAKATPGHNRPPVEAPDEATLKAMLEEAYPEAEKTMLEMEAAAKDVPKTIPVDDAELAGKVSLLLKKAADNRNDWDAIGVKRARPWKAAGNIVRNWFKSKEDRCDALIKDLKPRHTKWLEDKAEEEQREADARAEAAAKLAAEKKFDADWAEALVELAEYNARKHREDQERARLAEEEAREDLMWAEAREELMAYDARKAEERAALLEQEAATRRKDRKNELRRLTNEAKKLGMLDKAEGLTDVMLARYRELIGENGLIPKLKELLQDDRNLLTAEERAELDEETAALAKLREERAENRLAQEKARTKASEALQEAATAGDAAKALEKQAPALERKAGQAARGAAVHENRAVRADMAADKLTVADASRSYGEGGTVATLSGSWQPRVDDFNAIPPAMLWEHINRDAIDAAITKFRFANQPAWEERRGVGPGKGLVADALPGVTFVWTPDGRIA